MKNDYTIATIDEYIDNSYFSGQHFDGFIGKESTICLQNNRDYFYARTNEECAAYCRESHWCTTFTLTEIYYQEKALIYCQIYETCIQKNGVIGTNLYTLKERYDF